MKKRILTIMLTFTMISALVAGCGSSSDDSNEASEGGELQRYSLGAAGSGGTFYVWGAGWSSVINSNIGDQYDVSVLTTGGPQQNCDLLHTNECQLGFSTAFVAADSYNGISTSEKYTDLRVLFPMYSSYLNVFTLADSDINSFEDMNGKHIGTGTPGGSSQIVGDAIISDFGLKPREASALDLSAVIDGMKDGSIDAGFAVSSLPVPALTELEASNEIKLIPFTDEQLKLLMDEGKYTQGTIPAGTYKGQEEDVDTLTFWTLCLTNDEMSDDDAYNLTKATFEYLEQIGEAVGSTDEVLEENILNSPIPLHPGAIKYYEEKGVEIPDELQP